MPIYEYECKVCGHVFDTIQSFNEEPLIDCPVCKKPALKKLISASAFHLKGSGWYVTDFKNPPAKAENTEKAKTETNNPETKKETNQQTQTKTNEPAAAQKPADKPTKTDKSGEKSS